MIDEGSTGEQVGSLDGGKECMERDVYILYRDT